MCLPVPPFNQMCNQLLLACTLDRFAPNYCPSSTGRCIRSNGMAFVFLACERPEEPLVRMRILKKASSFGWIMRSIVQISDQFGFKIKHPFGLLYLSTHQFHRRHPHPFSLFSLHLKFFILAHVFRNLWTHHGGAGARNDGWRD